MGNQAQIHQSIGVCLFYYVYLTYLTIIKTNLPIIKTNLRITKTNFPSTSYESSWLDFYPCIVYLALCAISLDLTYSKSNKPGFPATSAESDCLNIYANFFYSFYSRKLPF